MKQYTYQYYIGECCLRLKISVQQQVEEKFQPFAWDNMSNVENTCVNEIHFIKEKELPVVEGLDLVREEDVMFSEYFDRGEYIRTFHGTGTNEPYAILKSIGQREWECRYLETYEYHFKTMDSCFGYIALERILMEQKTMILHASFIRSEEKGILFTGVSEIGKSTQAKLWTQYEQAEVINGDRTILHKIEGRWYGYGSPYAGSSRIYRNESAPIRAVVALGKSEENICTRLTPGRAFGMIYSGITLNLWNREYMNRATDMISELCVEVPIFHMNCRPDRSAVECLKQALQEI